ncbi:relaxase domain-containing protein (plasmid) [Streptomyces sp. NBC_01310]|uniref:MobF family relaxase n=1 Tax=Streptomyces sp. NBC_01310 TaxID=2903820 RepID=UPI0035B5B4B3|nr:relaxase domain-containing protein [Streptomyces sp. NBC_01310]
MQQVEYRLTGQCGCDLEHKEKAPGQQVEPDDAEQQKKDAQVDYRLGEARDLEWIGGGLADVGLVAGMPVDKDQARLLMDGRHPLTGELLVTPKVAVDPRGKVAARPLAEAIEAAAAERGVSVEQLLGDDEKLVKRFARLQRGVHREGDRHRVPFRAAEDLAEVSGVDLAELYGRGGVAEAREYADARIRVGNRGYDVTLDLSKTYSAAVALAGEEKSEELRGAFLEVARETFGALEGWAAYAMAGEHGNGKTAERVDTSGFLGWMTVHYSARPVGGEVGDPHLHVHGNLANMAHAEDGKWRTVGAGGRDIMRHAHAADAMVKARLRQVTGERFGMRWERHAETGAWEVVGIDEDLRKAFSRRNTQITAAAAEEATTGEQKLIARQLAESKDTTITQADVRAAWRERAETVVDDVDAMIRRAIPGPEGPDGPSVAGPGGGPVMPSPEEIAAYIWRREGGLTESRKSVTRADVLAHVIDATPFGVPDIAAAEALTDAVLAVDGEAVALPTQGMAHLTNPQRYTHASILAAEQTITETAAERLNEGAAVLTVRAAELAIATFEAQRTSNPQRPFIMSAEQRAVTHRLLTAGHGVDVKRGKAGTGKTTIMSAARMGWEAAGLRVSGAATAAVAASKLQAESGIKSATVATWLMDIRDGGRRMANTDVLVLEEAAMIDDRDVAELLTAAAENGVKVVMIGDWAQLKAIGVGGGFKRAHEIVGGLELSENRRQTDAVERAALEAWLDGGRRTALSMLAEHGRVHAVATPDDAYAEMLGAWKDTVGRLEGDVHDRIEDLVVLAARNADVEVLNLGARELRKKDGELTGGHTYAQANGERLELAAGDVIRIKRNDYRTRRGGDVDVLNGYRGQVTYAAKGGVSVEWRRPADDGGHTIERAWITADQIADGALQHGYAMTIAAAQGLTCDYTLVYGVGAAANDLYPAISRDRIATHLWLPADVVESQETRLRLGEARSDQERLERTVAAYADSLEHDTDDRMVSDELAPAPEARPVAPIPHQVRPEHERTVEDSVDRHGERERAETVQEHPEPAESAVRAVPGPAEPDAAAERAADRQARLDAARERLQDGDAPQITGEQKARLEQLLAAGFASRPEPQQEQRPEPEFEPWDDRKYGHLSGPRLTSLIAQHTAEGNRAERLAADYTRQAATWREALAAPVTPGQERGREVASVLDRADELAALAATERANEHQARESVRHAQEVLRRVAEAKGKSRLALRLAGTSRKETLEIAAEYDKKETEGYRELSRAGRSADDAVRQAWAAIRSPETVALFEEQGSRREGPRDVDELQNRLAAMRERLPEIERITDRGVARKADTAERQATEQQASAQKHTATAGKLQEEKSLRSRMATQAPTQHAAEAQQRAAYIKQAKQQAAERARENTRRAQQEYRYQPPTQGRSGPSLGR